VSNQKQQQQQQPERRIKQFPVLDGNVDSTDKNFLKNLEVSKSYETSYCEIVSKSQLGGGEKAIARHVKQHKKLLAEDRVKLLLDDYTEFLELSPIAGHAMEYGDVARAGILGGIVYYERKKYLHRKISTGI
jgi:3-methylcrotonyl-CoA carboxylase beta subunit